MRVKSTFCSKLLVTTAIILILLLFAAPFSGFAESGTGETPEQNEAVDFSAINDEQSMELANTLESLPPVLFNAWLTETLSSASDVQKQATIDWLQKHQLIGASCDEEDKQLPSTFSVPASASWPAYIALPEQGSFRSITQGGSTIQISVANVKDETYGKWLGDMQNSGLWEKEDIAQIQADIQRALAQDMGPNAKTNADVLDASNHAVENETGFARIDGDGTALFAFGGNTAVLTVSQKGNTGELDTLAAKSSILSETPGGSEDEPDSDAMSSNRVPMSDAEMDLLLDALVLMNEDNLNNEMEKLRATLTDDLYAQLIDRMYKDERFAGCIEVAFNGETHFYASKYNETGIISEGDDVEVTIGDDTIVTGNLDTWESVLVPPAEFSGMNEQELCSYASRFSGMSAWDVRDMVEGMQGNYTPEQIQSFLKLLLESSVPVPANLVQTAQGSQSGEVLTFTDFSDMSEDQQKELARTLAGMRLEDLTTSLNASMAGFSQQKQQETIEWLKTSVLQYNPHFQNWLSQRTTEQQETAAVQDMSSYEADMVCPVIHYYGPDGRNSDAQPDQPVENTSGYDKNLGSPVFIYRFVDADGNEINGEPNQRETADGDKDLPEDMLSYKFVDADGNEIQTVEDMAAEEVDKLDPVFTYKFMDGRCVEMQYDFQNEQTGDGQPEQDVDTSKVNLTDGGFTFSFPGLNSVEVRYDVRKENANSQLAELYLILDDVLTYEVKKDKETNQTTGTLAYMFVLSSQKPEADAAAPERSILEEDLESSVIAGTFAFTFASGNCVKVEYQQTRDDIQPRSVLMEDFTVPVLSALPQSHTPNGGEEMSDGDATSGIFTFSFELAASTPTEQDAADTKTPSADEISGYFTFDYSFFDEEASAAQ